MALSLDSLESGADEGPARILIYGPRGVGKTDFITSASDAIMIQAEDGIGNKSIQRTPLATKLQDIWDALAFLIKEDHPFKIVVLESLSAFERLVHFVVREEFGEDIFADFGKGYVLALPHFERLLAGLNLLRNKKGMMVIVTAHSKVENFKSPVVGPYDRYCIDVHRDASKIFEGRFDCILFANHHVFTQQSDTGFGNKQTRGTGKGERILYTEERPAYMAKNRYDLPSELPFEKGQSWATFEVAMKKGRTKKAA